MPVTGWKLDRASREFLVDIFPPRWRDLVADHVTLDARASRRDLPPPQADAAVIGHADDGEGLEALVVAIDGRTKRPDGSVCHITWSLDRDKGRRAAESNVLLTERGWRPLAAPIAIKLIPARF
ncbi:hypothetical protein [Sphingopyxis sp.]|uniref:hypothetical protein n=1 Tax=Sphingopyxis sp. TaxID=1908224 RepID=UPI001D3E2FC4|nr:hypothetical protein [Sphingopyxis sp.]MBW8297318.1 hypothetical protein [Sphingopyxis sp.]